MNRCSATVFVWSYRPCVRKGTVERDGKWYCRQHDPEAIAARQAKREAEWAAMRVAAAHASQRKELRAQIADEVISRSRTGERQCPLCDLCQQHSPGCPVGQLVALEAQS